MNYILIPIIAVLVIMVVVSLVRGLIAFMLLSRRIACVHELSEEFHTTPSK